MSQPVKPPKPRFPFLRTAVYAVLFVILPLSILSFALWPNAIDEGFTVAARILLIVGGMLFIGGSVWYCERILLPYIKGLEVYALSEREYEVYIQEMKREDRIKRIRLANRGRETSHKKCPNCGSADIYPTFSSDKVFFAKYYGTRIVTHYECKRCKFKW